MTDLKNIPLFSCVGEAVLAEIEPYFRTRKSIGVGERLMSLGERESDVFFLMKGRVRLSLLSAKGDMISYREITPFDYFGWLSALDGLERLTEAISLEKTEVIKVSAKDFQKILLVHPSISESFMRRIGGVVRRYTERIQDLTLLSARSRIVRELSRRWDDGMTVIDIGSHEDFATWTGTTRETVSRTLAALEAEGFIEKRGTRYGLLRCMDDPDENLCS